MNSARLVLFFAWSITLYAQADFALRDGDTVVFLGDSITAAREYGEIIEDYTLLRFPERKVRFINAGKGGETAKGSLARLEKDVFAQGATVVTVAYGVNDIGWGFKADAAHKQEYLEAIGELVERCRKRGVRVYICSAAITAEAPEKAETGFLQTMCDEGLALAKSKGAATIDVQRSMRQTQRRVLEANEKEPDKSKLVRMHVEDGVHLNELGQMAMAFAILKGLGAPAEVSSATIDAAARTVVAQESCRISEIKALTNGISFVRTDARLPLNLAPFWMLNGFYIPLAEELNRYLLTVRGLPPGRYEVLAGGRALGAWESEALAGGINIASASADPWEPGGPWDAQGHALKIATDMRDEMAFTRKGMERTLAEHPRLPKLRAETVSIEKKIRGLQRDIAQPAPVRFVVRKAPFDTTKAEEPVKTNPQPSRASAGAKEARTVPDDVAFCKEVLILHHSHVDVGYTHPQSMYWELQKGYLDAALDMLERTESWPDDVSKPRWTAEATAPVMRWLQTASAKDVARLQKHVKSGRFGISAFEYNTTPLCSAEGLARQLYPCRELRQKLGADIRTANQHDVNGIPWSAVDLLLDSHIELLTMAINLHLGGTPLPRPALYRWQGPSGRELLVMNGEHYTMFDQWANPGSGDLEVMQAGIYKYLRHVKNLKYPYDFVYLTATCAPYMYDNSPPNQELPDLIRQWNEEGRHPRLRMVTPNELLARIRQIPREQLPVIKGDWTDYWNFGAGSSAAETCLSRKLNANADAIELLCTWNGTDTRTAAGVKRLWEDLHLYNEHTWGAYNTLEADNPFVATLWQLKANPVYEGKPLSDILLRRQLQKLTGNPWQSRKTGGVLVFNPTGLRQEYYVPGTWKGDGKRIESQYLAAEREETSRPLTNLFGPIQLEPFSWQIVPWTHLSAVSGAAGLKTNANSIETDFYQLSFEPDTGKVVGLLDKKLGRQVLGEGAPWGFFQLVHEKPLNNERSAFHVRDIEGERYGRTGWKPDWKATRTSYTGPVHCRVEKHGRAATLIISGQAEGLTNLEQRITLYADSPLIDLSAEFLKLDVRSPEALYFVFPLELEAGWRAHFDTAGIPTELDAEQIPGTCRDWVTVDTFASVHQPDFGMTLYCPDAPMVQIGGFNWARKQAAIPRQSRPMLLAWVANNYWETNFRATQPGLIRVRYSFRSHGAFEPVRALMEGQQTRNPPVGHLVLDEAAARAGRLIGVVGQEVVINHVKPADDGEGIIVRLVNLGAQAVDAQVSLPGRAVGGAWLCGTLEEKRSKLQTTGGSAVCHLQPRQITTVRVTPSR